MIKLINNNKFGVEEYVCSTDAEVEQLPIELSSGSTCLVITTLKKYMFDKEDGCWYSLTEAGTKIKPIASYKAPVVTSVSVSPANPLAGETVTFSYEAEFDETTVEEVKWLNRYESYIAGNHSVGVQVKDKRGKWSDVRVFYFTVSKPKAPVVDTFTISPVSPKVGQTITYNHTATFERGASERDVWYSSNKKDSYDTPQAVTVEIKVKDTNNLWSNAKSLTFNVTPKDEVSQEETEKLERFYDEPYTIPAGYTYVSESGVGTYKDGVVEFAKAGQSVIVMKKVTETATEIITITKTVTVTVKKRPLTDTESEALTKSADEIYEIPSGYTYVSVSGVGQYTNGNVSFTGEGECIVTLEKVVSDATTITTITKTVTITVTPAPTE